MFGFPGGSIDLKSFYISRHLQCRIRTTEKNLLYTDRQSDRHIFLLKFWIQRDQNASKKKLYEKHTCKHPHNCQSGVPTKNHE